MLRWPVTKPATEPRRCAPHLTSEDRARWCEFLARRLDLSGESHSAEVARILARSHRRAAAVSA